MWPLPLFNILGYGINLYILIYVIGLFPAFALALWLGRERRISPVIVVDGCLIAVLAALGGGWLLSSLVSMTGVRFRMTPLNWSLASILLFVCFLAIHAKVNHARGKMPLDAKEFLDIVFPPLLLYLALRRFGCFSAGCCHGKPAWGLPWAVIFDHPASASLYKGTPVHPTQLYEAGGCLVILALLLVLFYRPAWRGTLAWVYLLAYGLLRFVVEVYRGDVRPMVGLLSLNQVVCIAFIIIGVVMLARRFAFSDRGFVTCDFRS